MLIFAREWRSPAKGNEKGRAGSEISPPCGEYAGDIPDQEISERQRERCMRSPRVASRAAVGTSSRSRVHAHPALGVTAS